MSETDECSPCRPSIALAVRWLTFFGLFFLIIWLWFDPKTIYHAHGWMLQYPIYVFGMSTFYDVPYFPGAVVHWVGGLLAHYYFYSALGAGIITAVTGLICFGADRYIVALGRGRWLRWLAFLPALAVLVEHGRYSQFLIANLSLAFVMLLLYAWTRISTKLRALSVPVFVALGIVSYLAAVEWFFLFVLMGVIFEIVVRRRWFAGPVDLILVAAVPIAASAVMTNLPAERAYMLAIPVPTLIDISKDLPLMVLLLILPLAGLDWLAHRMLPKREPSGPGRGYAGGAAVTVALLVAMGAVTWGTTDAGIRRSMRFNNFVRQGMWPEALDEARRIPDRYFTDFIMHDVNRALFYEGKLAEQVFAFPQMPGGLTHREGLAFGYSANRRAELLLELGHVNAAEHLSHETLEYVSYNPKALQRLALINMAKGLPGAASICLESLSKDCIYRDWADERLAAIEADPGLTTDPVTVSIRATMPAEDTTSSDAVPTIGHQTPLRPLLAQAFARNLSNRMAFEYGMMVNLSLGQPMAVIGGLQYLDGLGYPEGYIPRHYEEAILLHASLTGSRPELAGRQISTGAIARFQRFTMALARTTSARDAQTRLKGDFGDTYYYYVTFSLSMYETIMARLRQ